MTCDAFIVYLLYNPEKGNYSVCVYQQYNQTKSGVCKQTNLNGMFMKVTF